MIKIEFPTYQFKIKEENNQTVIFDTFRKRWIVLTPEEWVRQNFLQYLVQVKKYPASLIAIEKEISLNDLKKRFDIVVYKNTKPWILIECKEMNVKLSQKVVNQILNYNIALQVPYLVITNGNHCIGYEIKNLNMMEMDELPSF